MDDVDLAGLSDILHQMPVMAKMHPLTLAFLPDDVRVFEDVLQMIAELDRPTPQPTNPMLTTQIELAWRHRLPMVRCTHDPLTPELDHVLLKRYDFIKTHMVCQSQIADRIVRCANTEAIALMLVDGLSYNDIKRHAPKWLPRVTSALVDGVSITEHGMVRIVGRPPLVHQLFDAGFHHALGFTYWERGQEPLTDRLFTSFGDRVYKVKSFDEVLKALEEEALRGTFVQVIHAGLDSTAHRHRERPNVAAIVADILKDFEQLAAVFESQGISAHLHLVSDHGILWAHEHNFQIYELSDADHPRYYEHARKGEHTLIAEFDGKPFAMLEHPYLRRPLRSNEWGVHGGLSFEESVVPWISHYVGKEEMKA